MVQNISINHTLIGYAYIQSFTPVVLEFETIPVRSGWGVGKHVVIMLSQFNWNFNCQLELSLAKIEKREWKMKNKKMKKEERKTKIEKKWIFDKSWGGRGSQNILSKIEALYFVWLITQSGLTNSQPLVEKVHFYFMKASCMPIKSAKIITILHFYGFP